MNEMQFYNDAEFAAIDALRVALDESEEDPGSRAIIATAVDMEKRHGSKGVAALLVALARQYSAAVHVLARHRDITPAEFVDDFERHKLEQVSCAYDDE